MLKEHSARMFEDGGNFKELEMVAKKPSHEKVSALMIDNKANDFIFIVLCCKKSYRNGSLAHDHLNNMDCKQAHHTMAIQIYDRVKPTSIPKNNNNINITNNNINTTINIDLSGSTIVNNDEMIKYIARFTDRMNDTRRDRSDYEKKLMRLQKQFDIPQSALDAISDATSYYSSSDVSVSNKKDYEPFKYFKPTVFIPKKVNTLQAFNFTYKNMKLETKDHFEDRKRQAIEDKKAQQKYEKEQREDALLERIAHIKFAEKEIEETIKHHSRQIEPYKTDLDFYIKSRMEYINDEPENKETYLKAIEDHKIKIGCLIDSIKRQHMVIISQMRKELDDYKYKPIDGCEGYEGDMD
jgi:hypothetical protein